MLKNIITFYDSRFFNYQNTDGAENESHSKRGKARHYFNCAGDLVALNYAQSLDLRSDLFFRKYYLAGCRVCLV